MFYAKKCFSMYRLGLNLSFHILQIWADQQVTLGKYFEIFIMYEDFLQPYLFDFAVYYHTRMWILHASERCRKGPCIGVYNLWVQ